MAKKDTCEKTHEVYTPLKTRRGIIRFRLGCGVANDKGEVEVTLIGSPINGKLIVAPITAREPRG